MYIYQKIELNDCKSVIKTISNERNHWQVGAFEMKLEHMALLCSQNMVA